MSLQKLREFYENYKSPVENPIVYTTYLRKNNNSNNFKMYVSRGRNFWSIIPSTIFRKFNYRFDLINKKSFKYKYIDFFLCKNKKNKSFNRVGGKIPIVVLNEFNYKDGYYRACFTLTFNICTTTNMFLQVYYDGKLIITSNNFNII